MTNINEIVFPAVKEGDVVLHEDNKYYVYVNGTFVEKINL